jgi:uncharacterized protein with PIN domain
VKERAHEPNLDHCHECRRAIAWYERSPGRPVYARPVRRAQRFFRCHVCAAKRWEWEKQPHRGAWQG